jgi:hypothetical protein
VIHRTLRWQIIHFLSACGRKAAPNQRKFGLFSDLTKCVGFAVLDDDGFATQHAL